jgi:hypothetical protein
MTDYQNGKIYKIEANNREEGDVYFGSTCKFLSQRMNNHKNNYKKWKKDKKKYCTSFQLFEKYGIENCFITLIEIFPCNLKNELLGREAFYIRSMKCVNKYIPLRTSKEYFNDNRENMIQWKNKWSQDNRERIKQLYHDNSDKFVQYRHDNKKRILDAQKKFRDSNKEKIKENTRKIFLCECGRSMTKSVKARHLKSKIHNDLMLSKDQNLV